MPYHGFTMQTIAIVNHKGGVGKTATCHALGAVLAGLGRSVLLVDCDPQASLTGACGVTDAGGRSIAEVLGGASPGPLALTDVIRGLDDWLALVPSDLALATTELGLVSRLGREAVIGKALAPVSGAFDVALLDSPPSLSLLTIGALTASDAVIIPTMPQIVDLRALRLFLDSVDQVKQALNPDLQILGVLITFWDGRLLHHQEALESMQAAGLPVLDVKIGRSVRVSEAANTGQSVVTYDPKGKRTAEYIALGGVVNAWLNDRRR